MPTAAAAEWAIGFARSAADRLRRRGAMPTLYEVLDLPPGADEAQIKTAYRELAKRLHPDVNSSDAASVKRLAEVNHAYEILSDERTRSAYDHALAWQQAQMRRHYSLLAVCTGVTFAVTLIAVSSLVVWHLRAAPGPVAPVAAAASAPAERSTPVPAVSGAADEAGWTIFRDPRFEFALRYPAGIFAFDPGQSDTNLHTFVSGDRRATFRIVAAENSAGVSLARFRSTLIKKRYAGAVFDQTPQRRHWFALAGTLGEEAFLERVTFSCDGKSLHGWQIRYPLSQRATYEELANLVLRNAPHGNEPAAGCNDTKSKPKSRPKS